METLISTILSVFGLSQRANQVKSEKKSEASRLNTEFETLLHKTALYLRSEQVSLRHRLQRISEDTTELVTQADTMIETLLDEIDTGLETAKNNRETIQTVSSFAKLRQWDEVISVVYQQNSAAEIQMERAKTAVAQFHMILDNNNVM
ncbi:hypothetical protein [Yoonia sp. I 8.24]|uniref:hypothetical protein n=1 Tax=Yoonia sp. I 8.24 TaxID=1537229 RepID=UPI001EDCA0EE|nr:hypothetical protein [Yoonia sp. I 8.24]MCG3267582.1 hypothetical protein [Yoonia sp. I 8.24]